MRTSYFNIENTPCKAYLPDAGSVGFCVLAVHGFGGDKESSAVEALAEALAEALCPRSAAVYCFDFPAHGSHPANGEFLTVEACSAALVSAARYMRKAHPGTRAGVFATSFGGYMALLNLDELEGILGSFSLVLRAPAVRMADTFEKRMIGGQMRRLEAGGFVECGFERKIAVRRAFLEGLKRHDVCKPYPKPMMIIHGDADEVVTVDDIDAFVALNPLAVLERIPGAGHRFKGEGHLAKAVSSAAEYLLLPFKLEAVNDDAPLEIAPGILMENERGKFHGIFGLFRELNKPDLSRAAHPDAGYCVTSDDQIVLLGGTLFYKLAFDESRTPYWLLEPGFLDYFYGSGTTGAIPLADSQSAMLELDLVTRKLQKPADETQRIVRLAEDS